MMVYFRSRFSQEHHRRINDAIIEAATQPNKDEDGDDSGEPPAPKGKLLIDATCTPAGITYPTDLKLLNEAREKTEGYIDELYGDMKSLSLSEKKKPRTYRNRARKDYLTLPSSRSAPTANVERQSVRNSTILDAI